jgi:hypothetical protein
MFTATPNPERRQKLLLISHLQNLINAMENADLTSRRQIIWSLTHTFCEYCGNRMQRGNYNCLCRNEQEDIQNQNDLNGIIPIDSPNGLSSCVIKN